MHKLAQQQLEPQSSSLHRNSTGCQLPDDQKRVLPRKQTMLHVASPLLVRIGSNLFIRHPALRTLAATHNHTVADILHLPHRLAQDTELVGP